jgi:hypothetical protein
MNIRTEMYMTPWGQEWHAVDDDTYDGAEDSRSPMGWGKTEKQAIEDLKEQLQSAKIRGMKKLIDILIQPAT